MLKPATPPGHISKIDIMLALSFGSKHSQFAASKSTHSWSYWLESFISPIGTTTTLVRPDRTCCCIATYTYSSKTHHKRLAYEVPQRMSSDRHPAKKIGRH